MGHIWDLIIGIGIRLLFAECINSPFISNIFTLKRGTNVGKGYVCDIFVAMEKRGAVLGLNQGQTSHR